MNSSERLRDLFDKARGMEPPSSRAAFLACECAGNEALRAEIESLLNAENKAADGFMELPLSAVDLLPRVLEFNPDFAHAEPGLGSSIGPYRLVERLGEGGMGTVFMAEQLEPVRRAVALKLVRSGTGSREAVARFKAERQALALMDHPNIAKVYDAGRSAQGCPYFVMELVRGEPIAQYCDTHMLGLRERLATFVQVCRAIHHAHQKGIIHRDIKPSNILVHESDGKPIPKVIDFGIAKALHQKLSDESCLTHAGSVVGTLQYMSPEQADPDMQSAGVDTRSDVYSLGVVLYELLAGSAPLQIGLKKDSSLLELLRMIREEDPPLPSARAETCDIPGARVAGNRRVPQGKLARQLRGELDWIVMKALEKNRERRYGSAETLAGDVACYLNDEPVQASPPSRWYRATKFVRRNRWQVAAASVLIAALVSGLGVYVKLYLKERDDRAAAQAAEQEQTRLRLAAQSAAAKSAQIARFLEDIVRGIQPDRATGRDTSLFRELLDNTVQRLETDLKDQPEVEAQLRNTIGEAYSTLREYGRAEAMHARAAELLGALPGDNTLALSRAMHLQAVAMQYRDKVAARDLAEQALLLRRQSPVVDDNLRYLLRDLGTMKRVLGQYGEAEALYREALYSCDPRDFQQRLHAMCVLSGFLKQVHDDAGLQSLRGEALKLFDAFDASERKSDPYVLHGLADVFGDAGDAPKSAEMMARALDEMRKLRGTLHPQTADFACDLAKRKLDAGETANVVELFRESIELTGKLYGASHSKTQDRIVGAALRLFETGEALMNAGRPADAELLAREAAAIYASQRPDGWEAAAARALAGKCLLDQKRTDEGEPMLRAAVARLMELKENYTYNELLRVRKPVEYLIAYYSATGQTAKAESWRARHVALVPKQPSLARRNDFGARLDVCQGPYPALA